MPKLDGSPTDPESIHEDLRSFAKKDGDARARMVIAPAVVDELVDPILLDDRAFARDLLRFGHDCDFFSYGHGGKRPRADADSLSIEDSDAHSSDRSRAHFTLTTHGRLILEKMVGDDDERGLHASLTYMFELPVSGLANVFEGMLSFAYNVVGLIDQADRHPTWIYNAGLGSMGSRRIVEERSHASSYSMAIGQQESMIAFDRPRVIHRGVLRDERDREIERIVTMLRRRQG